MKSNSRRTDRTSLSAAEEAFRREDEGGDLKANWRKHVMPEFKYQPGFYRPGLRKFHTSPDHVGAVLTDERIQAFSQILTFGQEGPEQQKYVDAFFKGKKDASAGGWATPPYPKLGQLGDIGDYFTLDGDAATAINKGCANTRPEFIVGASAPGLDENGKPVFGVEAYCYNSLNPATGVSIANEGSEYDKINADFAHNVAVGYKG